MHYKKTYGEIAEQLADFRGEVKIIKRNGKTKEEPDLLKKHLNRIALINENLDALKKFTGINVPAAEGYVIFRNPVPMQFVWEKMKHSAKFSLYKELRNI